LKIILENGQISEKELMIYVKRDPERIRRALKQMVDEGFIKQDGLMLRIT